MQFGMFNDGRSIYIYNLLDRKMCKMTESDSYTQAIKKWNVRAGTFTTRIYKILK